MRVLVTGGTGFVGGWTAKAIADAGHSIKFLVRNPARLETSVAQLGVDTSDFAVGDISDRVSVRDALQGCEAVVHSAALVATDPRETARMLSTNMSGAQNVLGQAVELGLDPIVHVSSFTALFHPNLDTLRADLPVVGGTDGYGQSKAQVEIYARGLQDAGAPVNITYPGMVLGPPVGDQFGEAGEGVRSLLSLHVVPGRSAAWLIVDARDVAALHVALLEPGRGPRRYMAGGRRVPVGELASMFGEIAETTMLAVPVPDTVDSGRGRGIGQSDAVSALRHAVHVGRNAVLHADAVVRRFAERTRTRHLLSRSARNGGRHGRRAAQSEQLILFGGCCGVPARGRNRRRIVQPPLQPKQSIDNDADAQECERRHHNRGGHLSIVTASAANSE
jgi:dihydroflavonol-4-reductase